VVTSTLRGARTISGPGAELPAALEVVVAHMSSRHGWEPELVRAEVADILSDRFAQARIQSFIPILVEKELRERLEERAQRSPPS